LRQIKNNKEVPSEKEKRERERERERKREMKANRRSKLKDFWLGACNV